MPEPHADVREAHDAERFWRIIEAAPDGFVMVDMTGTIVLVNAQTEHLFGYERAELVGQPVEMLLPAQRAADPRRRA